MPRTRSDFSEAIQVDGLVPFVEELRALDKRLPHQLQVANKAVANFVAERAAQTARSEGRREARAAGALSVRATQRDARVLLDPASVPGAIGAEFGAQHDRLRETSRGYRRGFNQFVTWRGKGEEAGRFLWPTVRNEHAEIEAFYDRQVDDLLHRAFPN